METNEDSPSDSESAIEGHFSVFQFAHRGDSYRCRVCVSLGGGLLQPAGAEDEMLCGFGGVFGDLSPDPLLGTSIARCCACFPACSIATHRRLRVAAAVARQFEQMDQLGEPVITEMAQ